ncbi:hypothetical protein HY630_02235 [Candidatus Uhrbacteria bacterium]|nr:hypothetical protein [Candidatus Uhrbacteria bacterium]
MWKFVLRLYALHRWLSSRTKTITTKRVRVGIFALIGAFLFQIPVASASSHTTTSGSILNTDSILQIFADVAFSVAATITRGIVLLIDVMVPIMTFNNFVGNPVVKAGWAIVRDTVNMFFVVILIIIAFGTIFGAEKFKWQQQVPRLLIMAVVVNFSKTLCGILIDFGQVIMLTFANALREIAAGNFIQLLGLNEIYSASSTTVRKSIESGSGSGSSFDFFAAGVMSVVLTIWVFATLVILIAILLFRIIMLWVLVVIAPLAWFMKGAKGIIDSNAYEDWWKEFKCMVGIGPVLTFFLWLTLAVAGAGNVAANSGFDVSTSSNNAGFVSALLDLNNFLSFLIGMAMLFAGFKAASQFCSGDFSSKFVGKAIGAAKSVPALAGALGLKGGSLGLRAGARGAVVAGGALAAGSRYLPPGLRNIPSQMNPLNASRRAAMAGKVGGVLPEGFGGRYMKGKQADIEQGIRVAKFGGVNKEKEAMKNKDRDWKKGQIESMLKSEPRSQAGKDRMAALFEEMMGDKRLQKDLGRDKVEALWKSQGAKYKDMAKGNVAKTADIEGFEKTNADFTKSTHLIKDADDTKGLAADAWQDKAVQERAGRIPTTIKKDGKTLTALEAAREGHYGVDAQKAAIKGTDVSKLDIGTQMEEQFEAALRSHDKDSAMKVVDQMQAKYTAAGTSEQDRQRMALSMDRMRAANDKMSRGGNTTAAESLTAFDAARKGMETKAGSFGLPPTPAAGEKVDDYVNTHFGLSSGERIDAAMGQIDTEKSSTQGALAALDGEIQSLSGVEKTIADKKRQISDVRRQIEKAVEQAVTGARKPLVNLESELSQAKKRLETAKGSKNEKRAAKEVEAAQSRFDKAQANLESVKAAGNNQLTNSDEIASLEAEVQTIIDAAGGQAKFDEVNEKSSKRDELQAQVDRLQQTRDRLVQEKAKRTS